MMIGRSAKGDNHILKKKRKKEKKTPFSYKHKGSEGIVTHESSHNNNVQDFNT